VSSSRASKPRLLIADHPPTRLGLRIALDGTVQICAEAETAEEAIQAAERQRPDFCIIGRDLPGGAIVATRGICRAKPNTAVVIVTPALDPEDLVACIQAGAVGYLPGSIHPSALRRVVSTVLVGEAAVPRSLVLELVRELQGTAVSGANRLSPREAEVLALLRRGEPTAFIAGQLGISPVTVRRHISAMVRKTGSEDRGTLVRNGALPPAAGGTAARARSSPEGGWLLREALAELRDAR
jgi:DNA-binding NarL/FixJ family response regulator